jgi:hypothetical protein
MPVGWSLQRKIQALELGTCHLERKYNFLLVGKQQAFNIFFGGCSCIDVFRVPKACVSLSFSGNGAFLATAHVDDLGIYLWNNKSLFTQISLHALEADHVPQMAPLPGTAFKPSEEEGRKATELDEEYTSPEQLTDSLVTLSLLPDSRWKNLLNLDLIKVFNFFNWHNVLALK